MAISCIGCFIIVSSVSAIARTTFAVKLRKSARLVAEKWLETTENKLKNGSKQEKISMVDLFDRVLNDLAR